MKAKLGAQFETDFRAFDDNDLALEWCENHGSRRNPQAARTARPSRNRIL